MGFLTVGRRFLNNEADIIDDRIDVVTRGTMALTVTCARCHDHKYDPVPIEDYYSLYGVFDNSPEAKVLPVLTVATSGPAANQTADQLAFEKERQTREADLTSFLQKRRTEIAK